MDTSAFSDGQQLYLSPTTAGTFTATKPYAPQHLVYVAVVEHAHPTQGKLFVKVQNGYEMDELHDVSAQSPSNNHGLFYNTTSGLWENKSIATALGYTPANISGPTFTNGVTVTNGDNLVSIAFDGNLEIVRAAGNGYIDFKNTLGEDFDSRIQQIGSGFSMTGTVSAGDEFRAPIFRDTPNTAYFIDPAGTSNISGLTLDGTLTGVTGRFAKNQTAGNYTTAALWTESYGNTATGIAFHISGVVGKFLEMRTDGILYWQGILNSDGELRAPIFRDMDNGAYYVDPAGTSNLNNLTLNTGPVYRSDWTTRFQSGSDFANGTLVTTDIPATGFAGESFLIEITGKSYSASNLPFKVVAQGYLYDNTIINYTGISYGGDFATYIKVFEEGGVLKFWWPRISYWNSFNVNVMAMDGPTNNTITRNRVTAIGNSTEPTGTKKQQINLTKTLKTGDAAGSISGFNNPTTAPTANTIVYRDGIGDIAAREIILSSGLSTVTPTVLVSMYPTTNQMVRTTPAAVAAALTASGGVLGAPITFNNMNNDHGTYTDANLVGNFGFRYLQGATNGPAISGASQYYGMTVGLGSNYGFDSFASQFYWPRTPVGGLAYPSVRFKEGGNWGAWTKIYAGWADAPSGAVFAATGDFRAPVFYDSPNTAFFVDPDSTSRLSVANVNFITLINDEGLNVKGIRGQFAAGSDGCGISLFSNVDIGYPSGWGSGLGNTPSRGLSVYGGLRVAYSGGGFITCDTSVRAPIFYDIPDTGFYVDPSSTSNISGLTVGNRISGSISGDAQRLFNHTGANNDGLQYWNTVGNSTLNPNTGWHYALRLAHGDADTYYSATIAVDFFAENVYLRRKVGGTNQPWMRFALYNNVYDAPFYASSFIDANNGAFFLDPSSTGTSLNVAGNIIAAGNVTAYSDIRVKNNVETIPSALGKLSQIRGVTYTRTDLDDKERRYAGVIAQEIEAVLPEAVRDLGNIKAVDYNATIALLIEAVKELSLKVKTLEEKDNSI
jgi:hypothetical protein